MAWATLGGRGQSCVFFTLELYYKTDVSVVVFFVVLVCRSRITAFLVFVNPLPSPPPRTLFPPGVDQYLILWFGALMGGPITWSLLHSAFGHSGNKVYNVTTDGP